MREGAKVGVRTDVGREAALVVHVVDREQGAGGAEDRVVCVDRLEQHGEQGSLPVVAVHHIGGKAQSLAQDDRHEREREKAPVLIAIAGVEPPAREQRWAVHKVHGRLRAGAVDPGQVVVIAQAHVGLQDRFEAVFRVVDVDGVVERQHHANIVAGAMQVAGRAAITSARPPVLAKGAISDATNNNFTGSHDSKLRGGAISVDAPTTIGPGRWRWGRRGALPWCDLYASLQRGQRGRRADHVAPPNTGLGPGVR